MDVLRNALAGALGIEARAPVAEDSGLPDPMKSEWVVILRRHGVDLPAKPTMGQIQARSDQLGKKLKTEGRGREKEALDKARSSYEKELDKDAWGLVKARFTELDLPERAYRALKQEDADPVKLIGHLKGARGDALKGLGAEKVRDALRKTS